MRISPPPRLAPYHLATTADRAAGRRVTRVAKRRDKRPQFDALCRDATKRQFDVVMAWSVDRLGRSLQDLASFLTELHALKIDLFLHQQGIDTTTPGGKAMFQMMGVFAEFERSMIQERVRAGLRRAVSEGKQLGRRSIAPELEERVRKALNARKETGPGRPQDRRALRLIAHYSAEDKPPFRGKRRRMKR